MSWWRRMLEWIRPKPIDVARVVPNDPENRATLARADKLLAHPRIARLLDDYEHQDAALKDGILRNGHR